MMRRESYDFIHQHRMHWVMQLEAGRDFGTGDETVVTAIEIAELADADERPVEYTTAKVLEMG